MNPAAQRWALGVWLVLVVACVAIISRTAFSTDISAFLPRSPTPAQQLLVDQLRDGVVPRLVLIGIDRAAPDALAQASRRLAAELRGNDSFVSVENGEDIASGKDRDFFWRNRYLLSPAVTPERFTPRALRERLEEHLRLLGSPAGLLVRRVLPGDPTGELLQILERIEGQSQPPRRDGVWFSPDGARALLVAQTRAAGYDIDAQERALAAIHGAFERTAAANGAQLRMSGPGVFAISTRATIKSDAWRFSLIATVVVAAMMLALYRSVRVVALGFVPVATGALAGVAAVALGFGAVHGVTLGFGVTLIGEGVDYAIYLFTQASPGVAPQRAFDRIWPTLRLGVLTSILGFSAMLLSGFTGLAQLGLFSITGLIVAAAVTRWVLPALLPSGFTVHGIAAFAPAVMGAVRAAPRLRYPLFAVLAIAGTVVATQRTPLWSDDLASLSPIARQDRLLDEQLRRDLGAPDVRHLVVISATDDESVLRTAEAVGAGLEKAVPAGLLQGYDSPARYLPSREAQRVRQAAIPAPDALRANLKQALRGLPYRPEAFEPFLKDAAAAKTMPLVERASLDGSRIATKVDTLLVRRERGWVALMPLRGVTDAAGIAKSLGAQAVLLDLKVESDRLYADYRREALVHSLLGAAAIVVLLFAGLRSARRVVDVLAPLAAAVIVTACLLTLGGRELTIFHLVGLLLVVAVGSNYSLFFDRQAPSGTDHERTIVSLLFAALTTMIGFGLLSFSSVPVLHGIGSTVALGALFALLFSAILARPVQNGQDLQDLQDKTTSR
jgi:predicted exporter